MKLSKKEKQAISKSVQIEEKTEIALVKLANFRYKNKLKAPTPIGSAMVFGTIGKDSKDFLDKKGNVKKGKKYYRINYKIEFLDKIPASYMQESES